MDPLDGRLEVISGEEEEELRLLLPVLDVLGVGAPQLPVPGLRQQTPAAKLRSHCMGRSRCMGRRSCMFK